MALWRGDQVIDGKLVESRVALAAEGRPLPQNDVG